MERALMYEIKPQAVRRIFEKPQDYGLLEIDVENAASILDDMLKDESQKRNYALRLMEENSIDWARLIITDDGGVIVVKIGNVVSIRARVREYGKIIGQFGLTEVER